MDMSKVVPARSLQMVWSCADTSITGQYGGKFEFAMRSAPNNGKGYTNDSWRDVVLDHYSGRMAFVPSNFDAVAQNVPGGRRGDNDFILCCSDSRGNKAYQVVHLHINADPYDPFSEIPLNATGF
jgi:hypothetical protein